MTEPEFDELWEAGEPVEIIRGKNSSSGEVIRSTVNLIIEKVEPANGAG